MYHLIYKPESQKGCNRAGDYDVARTAHVKSLQDQYQPGWCCIIITGIKLESIYAYY